MSDENPNQCPVCEGPMKDWQHDGSAYWKPIETRPDDVEFIAYDPVSGKQDVCYAILTDVYGYLDVTESGIPYSSRWGVVGTRKSCDAVQQDGEYGPDENEFQGKRATHWIELYAPPKPQLQHYTPGDGGQRDD